MTTDIDQAGIIENLIAENKALRSALRDAPCRELQIASQIRILLNELSRIGPATTARALTWAFDLYTKNGLSFYEHQFIDRRPKEPPTPVAQEPPAPPVPTASTEREMRGAQLRQRRVAAGMTQNALARHIGGGIHQAEISNIELGRMVVSEDRWQLLFKAVEIAQEEGATP